jgi:hypothetical protein
MLLTRLSPAIQMTEDVYTGGSSEGGLYHCWALHQVQSHNNLPVDMKLQAYQLSNTDTLMVQVFWDVML